MSKYRSFVFEDYTFDQTQKTLKLRYSLDSELFFEEVFTFNFEFVDYDETSLDKAIQKLFFIAGVSYYKTYIPQHILVKSGSVTQQEAEFYGKTYQKGLGEFFYVNKLDPTTPVVFPVNNYAPGEALQTNGNGLLVAVGGGKDSLVSIETLRGKTDGPMETWSLNHAALLQPLVERIGLKHYNVDRIWDSKLNEPGSLPDSYNGHVPISAIFACTGVIVALLTGRKDVVMSNERSADEATLEYRNVDINHQYSKTSEFEKDFQAQLRTAFGESVRYYSLLRPLSEVQITKLFSGSWFDKYKDVFSSCNQAFRRGSTGLFWDGSCSKCAFIYLIFSQYIPASELDALMHSNLLQKPELENTYRQLLGIADEKPLECVGEINESRWAMDRCKQTYSELAKYSYPPVSDDDIFYLAESTIPPEILNIVTPTFEQTLQK